MYQVFCDDELIYNPSIDALKIKSPKVNLEVNKVGSFEFQIYPNHPFYEDLKKLKSIIKVYQDGYLLFRGRIIDDSVGFHNEKQVTCEGELAFLLDSIQRPYSYTGDIPAFFAQIISNHNSQVDAEHQFKVGNITVVDSNGYVNRSDTTYQNTFNALTSKLIDTHGGYLWVRHESDGNYLDYLSDFTALSNQPVEFGKNLLDLSRRVKGADIATAIIPLGAKLENTENRVTIASVNGGVDYVYSQDAVNLYGWIFRTQSWDDVTLPANLLTKANEYLTSTINLSTEIELSAVDLSALNTNFSSFHLGTYVPVKTTPHGIDQNFLVNKLSIDLANPQSNKLILGTTLSSFTEQNISASKNTQTLVSNLDASQTEAKSALVNLTEQTTTTAEHLQGEITNLQSADVQINANISTLQTEVAPLTYNGVAHNTIYRGKSLGSAVTAKQYAAISAGTFEDLYIGDYWTIGGVNYRIAAFDYYWNCGDTAVPPHHAVIVPEKNLYKAVMNTSGTTPGGYVGSQMYTTNLEQAKTTIKGAFSGHVVNHRIYLVNGVANGCSSGGAWFDSEVDLMNEQMVYGSGIFSPTSTGSSTPANYRVETNQLPLFAMNPAMLHTRENYWLRDVINLYSFAFVIWTGYAGYIGANGNNGVRPSFCIS